MAERRLAFILMVAAGALLLVGCECNRGQFSALNDNLSGSDLRRALKDCSYGCDAALDGWSTRAAESLSGLNDNVSGADLRRALKDCSYGCDAAFDGWSTRAAESLSGLNDNVSGADWRENIEGSCGESAKTTSTAPARPGR
jgi:hypothetical protein